MIDVTHQHPRRRFSRKETLRVVGCVLRETRLNRLHLSVVFTDDRFMRRINREFLNHDWITDVIAFPLKDGTGVDAELYVNLDRARRQAQEYQVSMANEVGRLLIHGVLHLAGYRDTTRSEQARMRRTEERYLSRLKRDR